MVPINLDSLSLEYDSKVAKAGLWGLCPVSPFSPSDTGPQYSILAPEWPWSFLSLICHLREARGPEGLFQFFCLLRKSFCPTYKVFLSQKLKLGARWWHSSKIWCSVRPTHMRRFWIPIGDLPDYAGYTCAYDPGLPEAQGTTAQRLCGAAVPLPLAHGRNSELKVKTEFKPPEPTSYSEEIWNREKQVNWSQKEMNR